MEPVDPLIGRMLANYQIERMLGKGGMASVYYAFDLQLQRPAAIKLIDDRYRNDSAYSDRFVHEARAMASWRHPNIPQVYQAGVEDGISFYAMEYIQGLDLDKLLQIVAQRGEILSFEDVLLIGRAIADALDYAHSKGAIHRDVKPSNVLVSEDDRILLTDFGLVLEMDKGTHGEVFGSPHYIAPEQVRSSALAVPQSDLYALGVILYEMLVGRLPFDDPSPASLAIKHITDEPPAPRQINPDLSPEVEAVLLKALRKLPEERYQTGKELMDALESTVTSSPAHKDSTQFLDQPPSTLTVLPGIAENLRPPTISRLAAMDLYSGDAQTPPAIQAVSEPVGKTPVEVNSPRQWISTHKLVFFSFLAVGVLSMLFGSILVPRWLFGSQNLPTQTSSAVGLPDPLVYQERATSTAVISTRVGIPKYTDPTRNSTISPTRTLPPPTPTIGPAATPVDEGEIHLTIAKHKEDSLFVINQGTTDFPLALIRFGNKDGEVIGEQWGVEVLHPGQCAGVWKKEGNPEVPKEIQCESVGEQLVISEKKFWNSNLEVYFKDLSVGVCDKKDLCELSFVSFP